MGPLVTSVSQVLLLLVVIVLKITQGVAQLITLTESSGGSITCLENAVEFRCTVSTEQVEWRAGRFIISAVFSDFQGDPSLIIQNDVGPQNAVAISRLDIDPLTTSMVIDGSLLNEMVNISCIPQLGNGTSLEGEAANILYRPESNMTAPGGVTNLNVQLLVDSCTSDASLTVSFTAPTSVDITGFIVNCSDSTCEPTVLGPSEEKATLAATDSDHVVNVYTVNRCDQTSAPASGRSQREQISNECVNRLTTSIVFGVLTLGFAVAFVVTLVIIILICCCKKGEGEEQLSREGKTTPGKRVEAEEEV